MKGWFGLSEQATYRRSDLQQRTFGDDLGAYMHGDRLGAWKTGTAGFLAASAVLLTSCSYSEPAPSPHYLQCVSRSP